MVGAAFRAALGGLQMILIGQFDSPFVRRVAIALDLYGLQYEHRPWSTFGDAELIAPYNPLRRVPILVLSDTESLIESAAIAESGPARRQALKICALATGLNDKAVSLFYERALHEKTSPAWIQRCETQIRGVLNVLDADRRARTTSYWFGDAIGHADIAVACAMRYLGDAHPGLTSRGSWPALAAHAHRCEALEPFKAIFQAFLPPA
jgi:glutathione S-transferase